MPDIHQCRCNVCTGEGDENIKAQHHWMNVLMSRLNEQQRRWYAAVEAKKRGHGGTLEVSKITGLHVETIRQGRREMEKDLQERPTDRVRLPGGGRRHTEKKSRE